MGSRGCIFPKFLKSICWFQNATRNELNAILFQFAFQNFISVMENMIARIVLMKKIVSVTVLNSPSVIPNS